MRGINLHVRQNLVDDFCFALSLESPRIDIASFAEKFAAENDSCIPAEQLAAIGENSRNLWHNADENPHNSGDCGPLPADDAGFADGIDSDDEDEDDGGFDYDDMDARR